MPPAILSKEITIPGKFTATLPVWASLGTTFLATVFYIIGYATTGWGYVEQDRLGSKISQQIGLWQTCHSQLGCRYWTTSEMQPVFRAVQAFATIALVFIFFAVLGTILYIFVDRTKRVLSICFMLAGCHVVSFVLLLVALSTFGARWRDSYPSSRGYRTSVAYSVALSAVALILEVAGAALVALEALSLKRNQNAGSAGQQQRAQAQAGVPDMTPPAANYAEPTSPSAGSA